MAKKPSKSALLARVEELEFEVRRLEAKTERLEAEKRAGLFQQGTGTNVAGVLQLVQRIQDLQDLLQVARGGK